MRRAHLEHLLRAASTISGDRDVLVIGSQSVLAALSERTLPEEATASIEADIAFFDDPDDTKADQVDGAIGELSPFHEQYGYYAQGVSVSTAILPAGWRAYLAAAGGHARLVVDFDDGARRVELDLETLGQRPDPTPRAAPETTG